jgi:hypothetical protein
MSSIKVPEVLIEYYKSDKPLTCELEFEWAPGQGASIWDCLFWPPDEVMENNAGYEVQKNVPGCFGFASNGGGEMFAINPDGAVVLIPFIVMSRDSEVVIAGSWPEFERSLRVVS